MALIRRLAPACLAVTLTGVALLGVAPAAADPHNDKARVDQQLAQVRALYEDASAAVQAAMAAYAQATQALPGAQQRVAEADGVVAARQAEANDAHRKALAALAVYQAADGRYSEASAQVGAASDRVSRLTTSAYKGSNILALSMVLASGSPGDFCDQLAYLDRVARNQNEALATFVSARRGAGVAWQQARAARQQADAADRDAAGALASAQAARAAAAAARDAVTALIAMRAHAVAVANQQRASVLARYRALKAESDRIAAQLRALAGRDRTVARLRPGAHFLMPVDGWKSSNFGWRYDPYYHVWQLHAGVDLAAPGGTPIYAAADGRVARAGWASGYGNYTCLYHGRYHGHGLSTCYGHQSRILVHVGQWVHRGQLIGRVGETGAATGYHLHFEVRIDGRPVQPLSWLPACLCQ
jgi:murein DD-endopeptidase MepM/ murein hydrolase activator NlpD